MGTGSCSPGTDRVQLRHRGECNKRVFEVSAAGALLFQESSNQEARGYFGDYQECIFYKEEDQSRPIPQTRPA
jgi:hypothetical protein